MCKTLLEEGAKLNIYDPKVDHQQIVEDLTHPCVTESPEYVRKAIEIFDNAYDAVADTYAIVLCTEWDEFVVSVHSFAFVRKIMNCFFHSNLTTTLQHITFVWFTFRLNRNWTIVQFTIK